MILSLQGCMAVGKTTALGYLERKLPQAAVSREENAGVIAEIRRRGLDKDTFAGYCAIQRLWLANEVRRYEAVKDRPCVVMDFGAEEILFHTLAYPKTIGADWDVEGALGPELDAVRACLPDHILFLEASDETLRRRKAGDPTRSRSSFEEYLQKFLPLKRTWLRSLPNVEVLNTDGLTADEVGRQVLAWAVRCLADGGPA